jgi:hypothetical protein
METGKVKFAPDYKSKARSIADIAASHVCTEVCDPDKRLLAAAHKHVDDLRAKRVAEHARLQAVVVEQVKAQRRAEKSATVPNDFDVAEAQRNVRVAVDALIAFEVEHEIGEWKEVMRNRKAMAAAIETGAMVNIRPFKRAMLVLRDSRWQEEHD